MRLTLAMLFTLAVAVLVAVLAGFVWLLDTGSSRAVEASASGLRRDAVGRVRDSLEDYLGQGEHALQRLGLLFQSGQCGDGPGPAAESCVLSVLLENTSLSEISVTVATEVPGDELSLEPLGRWQLSAHRPNPSGESGRVCTRTVRGQGEAFNAESRCRDRSAVLLPAREKIDPSACADPTDSPGFSTPATPDFRGRTLWSDLSYSQVDQHLPEKKRRVQLTALRGLELPRRRVMVVKAGLLEQEIDRQTQAAHVSGPNDEHVVFLADGRGRLVSRLDPSDQLVDDDDDLRIRPAKPLPPHVAKALGDPLLAADGEEGELRETVLMVDGRMHHLAVVLLPNTQGWRLAIVGPEDFFRRDLDQARRALVGWAVAALTLTLLVLLVVLRSVSRGFQLIGGQTRRMSGFEFGAETVATPFADVREALQGLELAKTAMRAMSRYVPVDLVRRLFDEKQEPRLGGQPQELSVMFTDLEGFTTLVESLPVNQVAAMLGRYLEVMTQAVHQHQGTVDKFIGDAVMALWNAPNPVREHPRLACAAALECVRATRALCASEAWAGNPALVTRFGLHTAEVLVGNFGAPDRFNFTAIGDGVNLAARLESLNKRYGTTILVSDAVEQQARDFFAFRRVDLVAVKGKTRPVAIFELLGPVDAPGLKLDTVRRYEEALARFVGKDFDGALGLLQGLEADGPSRVLRERCLALKAEPPPEGWNGVFVADEK